MEEKKETVTSIIVKVIVIGPLVIGLLYLKDHGWKVASSSHSLETNHGNIIQEKQERVCKLCGNTGVTICTNCNGTGYTTYGNLPCTTCEPGSPHSAGTGYVKCNLHTY